jgi:hypothetical protein
MLNDAHVYTPFFYTFYHPRMTDSLIHKSYTVGFALQRYEENKNSELPIKKNFKKISNSLAIILHFVYFCIV